MSRGLFYSFMCHYDRLWRKFHKVEYINDLVSLSLEPWQGERKAMNDGTWIEPGDCLAILHFNRECFMDPGTSPKDYIRAALHFRKLILTSFGELAERFRVEERFKDVKAFHGVSWLPPHGEKVGFMIEKVPDSWGNRFRNFYFKILLKTFFPVLAARQSKVQSHAYWLTRQQLFTHFSQEAPTNDTGTVPESRPVAVETIPPEQLTGYSQIAG